MEERSQEKISRNNREVGSHKCLEFWKENQKHVHNRIKGVIDWNINAKEGMGLL